MKKTKHILFSLILFLSLVIFCIFFSFIQNDDFSRSSTQLSKLDKHPLQNDTPLIQFGNQILMHELSSDMLSFHFNMKSISSSFDKKKYELHFSPKYNSHHYYENQYKILQTLQMNSNNSSLEFKTLSWYLKNQCLLSKYAFFEEPLSPDSGIHVNTFFLLSSYDFYSEEDIIHYLSFLKSMPNWVTEIVNYEKSKKEANHFMSYNACITVYNTCITYANSSTYLKEAFTKKIYCLMKNHLLSQSQYNFYVSVHNTYLNNYFINAYQTLGNQIIALADSSISIHGLSYSSSGSDYYNQFIICLTGTHRTIEEMLYSYKSKCDTYYYFSKLYQNNPQSSIYNTQTLLSTSSKIILKLKQLSKKDFPALPIAFEKLDISVNSIPIMLEPYCSTAFYLLSPIDNLKKHSIFLNTNQPHDEVSLITTLGHESFPGHLYQHCYSSNFLMHNSTIKYINFFSTMGFQEGWGLYSEIWTYNHLSSVNKHLEYENFISYKHLFLLYLLSYIEVNVHYNHWTFSEVQQLLKKYEINDSTYALSIYTYICQNPGSYVQYVEGYSEIQSLKEFYTTHYNFTDYNFHKYLLTHSYVPFSLLFESLSEK